MFVYNNCKHDARVLKEAKTLTEAGYDVRIIAVLDKTTEPYEKREGFRIIRVVKNPLHYKILKGILSSTKKFLSFLNCSISRLKRQPVKVQSVTRKAVGKLRLIFQKLNQVIKEKGLREYVRKSLKTCPGYFLSLGWALVLGYYFYKGIKKIFYWGFYYPAKCICFFFYKGIKKIFYWGFYYPAKHTYFFLYGLLRNFLMIFHRPLSFLDYYQRSFKIIEQEPADIYHAHDLNTLPIAFWAKKKLGGKLVYDSHELYTEKTGLNWLERFLARIIERNLIGKSDRIITVNHSIAGQLEKRYNLNISAIVMNCPVAAKKNKQQHYNRKFIPVSNKFKVVIYQGGFAPGRGLFNLIKAIKLVSLSQIILVLIGWGKLESELKSFVETDQELHDKVIFLPPVSPDKLIYVTKEAHLGVIPFRKVSLNNYYGLPNKMFEYLMAGLPVAASDFPELRKIVLGHKLGAVFNPEDPEDIARAIDFILSNPKRYRQMKENAKKAAKIYNWENESKKLLKVYSELTNKNL